MAKVIFTYYPLAVYYNHGLSLLLAICKSRGIETYVIPLSDNIQKSFDSIKPDFIGFGFVTCHEYEKSKSYIDLARKTGAVLMAGGVFARSGNKIEGFDYVCRGEGEILPDFILNGDTKVFDEKYLCEDISLLPDYSTVFGDEFARNSEFLKGKKIIPYTSSRGCPYQCSFCITHEQSKKVRIKTTIREDLALLNKIYNQDLFHIMDELPPYYKQEWLDQMEGNEHKFFSFIRADIKQTELEFLINNGLSVCSFGVEVGDEEYRNKVLNKGITDKDIWRTVELLQSNNIPFISFFMTGMEPEEVKWKTFDMAENLGGEIIIFEYEDLRSEVWAQ